MSSRDDPPPARERRSGAGATEPLESPVTLFAGIVAALALVVALGMCGGEDAPRPTQTEQP